MNIRFFSCLLLLFLGFLPSPAQSPPPLWFHHLGKEEGLISASVIDVFQDSEGFVWVGTQSGLDRYDGRSVFHYLPDASDSTALKGNIVAGKFFEDSNKNIWFCTYSAIICYNRRFDHFESYAVQDVGVPINSGYKALYLERDSLLWVQAEGRSIYCFNTLTHRSSAELARTAYDIDAFPGLTADGRLRYLVSVDGSKSQGLEVLEFDGARRLIPASSFKAFNGDDPDHPPLYIHKVIFESETVAWLSANAGIYKLDIPTRQFQAFPTGHANPVFIGPYDINHFWALEVGLGMGLFNKRDGSIEPYRGQLITGPMRDVAPWFYNLYISPAGHIWTQIFDEGLLYAAPDKVKFRAILKYPGVGGEDNYAFRAMAQRDDQKIWCSTHTNGIYLLDRDGAPLRHYHPRHSQYNRINSRQIIHMMLSRNQQLWVATNKGASYFDPATDSFIPILDEGGRPVDYVSYLYQLRENDDILASTLQHGVFRVSGQGKPFLQQAYPSQNEFDLFSNIYQDQLGSVYISRKMAEIAVFNYKDGKLELRATHNISGMVTGFYEDEDGKALWVATSSGLIKLDKTDSTKPYEIFTTHNGLQSNDIQSLALGRDGNLWLSTSAGISRFNRDSSRFVNFNLDDGIQSRQFNALAVLNHQDGSIWFGGDNGITIVEPENIRFLETKPQVQVTEIKINDELFPGLSDAVTKNTNVHTISRLKLKYDQNTISISFVAIDYSGPASTQLKYMMKGADDGWVALNRGEPGFARYSNLRPKEYTFMIQAVNSDGILSDEVKELSIIIRPPWYQSWWARTLFVLLAALVLYAAYRYRVNQIRKEAEYKQLVAENETAVLRLQMNPHFIFNSMNSISSYILNKDIDTANDYLHRFAKLMRMILNQSEKPFLSISEEVELLEQYLNTEAMRFEDKVEYEISIAPGLDPDEVVIPTMILQPFVENAIWHGLARKEGPKKITIGFEQHDGQLCCSVEDNGVGRAVAGQEKPAAASHQSKAIAITTRRLRILEEMESATTSLAIIDLVDAAGLPAGTRAEVRLPVL